MPVEDGMFRAGSSRWTGLALWSSVVLLGLAALALSLLWYMPVRFAAQQASWPLAAERLTGTLRSGQYRIDAVHALNWRTDLRASVAAFAVVADLKVTGPGTDLSGRIRVRGRAAAALGPLTGEIAWPLVAAALPGAVVTCDGSARLMAVGVTLARSGNSAAGTVAAPAGNCTRTDGALPPVPRPALTLVLSEAGGDIAAVLTGTETPAVPLATVRLTAADRLVVTVHRAGAALVPGLPAGADSEIDLPINVLLP